MIDRTKISLHLAEEYDYDSISKISSNDFIPLNLLKIINHESTIILNKEIYYITYTIDSIIEDYSGYYILWEDTINLHATHTTIKGGFYFKKPYVLNSIMQDVSTSRILNNKNAIFSLKNIKSYITLTDDLKNYFIL